MASWADAFDQPFVVGMVKGLSNGQAASICKRVTHRRTMRIEPTRESKKDVSGRIQSHLEQQMIELYNAANVLVLHSSCRSPHWEMETHQGEEGVTAEVEAPSRRLPIRRACQAVGRSPKANTT